MTRLLSLVAFLSLTGHSSHPLASDLIRPLLTTSALCARTLEAKQNQQCNKITALSRIVTQNSTVSSWDFVLGQ